MPVTAKNFIDTFTDSPNSHNKQGLAFLPLSHEDSEAQKKLNILAKATWQWVGPNHSSRSLWLQGPCSPQITGTSLYFLQTACPKLQWWCHPLNFHLVHFFLRSAITQNICLQSFSHSNYFPGRNSPKSTPHPPHPLHEAGIRNWA